MTSCWADRSLGRCRVRSRSQIWRPLDMAELTRPSDHSPAYCHRA